jgi:6,7-dimethyl-8-ribityllumazine synthase
MTQLQVIEGQVVVPSGVRFVVVASRFNHFIVDRLVDGAVDAVRRHGGQDAPLALVKVPGAWEIPHAVARIARKVPEAERGLVGIVALGAVIRGSTPHFDYVANEVTKGIASVSLETASPSRSASSRPTRSSKPSSAPVPRPATRVGRRR